MDHLFLEVGVNVECAVGDGMTIAELHDASSRYVSCKKLPVLADYYHFDEFSVTPVGFEKAFSSGGNAGIDGVVILNFHSSIAHGKTKGGGHFLVLTGPKPNYEDLIMVDVHDIKYGEYSSTPREQIFAEMMDKDACGRSRGAIRFGRIDRNIARPLNALIPSVVDWTAPPAPYESAALQRYIPKYWDTNLGVENMEGVSSVASAMSVLEGDESPLVRQDEIMRVLRESYTSHVNTFLEDSKIADMVIYTNCTRRSLQGSTLTHKITLSVNHLGLKNLILVWQCFHFTFSG